MSARLVEAAIRKPRVVVTVEYEGSVTVGIHHVRSRGEEQRLRAWIDANPELRELVEAAVALRSRA